MQHNYETNFEPVATKILSDLAHGLVIVAELDGAIVGFMMFTYEWSDWRDGVFLWFQAVEATNDEAYAVMKAQLHEFAKSDKMKYKFCGVRLSGLKKLAHENKCLTELFDLSQTHYYIYHTDSTQAWLVYNLWLIYKNSTSPKDSSQLTSKTCSKAFVDHRDQAAKTSIKSTQK